jgi:phosphoglucomutase
MRTARTLVLGGDGRFHNRAAVQTILRMAAAHGYGRVLVGRGGILSTPAASCVIRKHGAAGAIILSASHNPGGPGRRLRHQVQRRERRPAPEKITDAVLRARRTIERYRISDGGPVDIDRLGVQRLDRPTSRSSTRSPTTPR